MMYLVTALFVGFAAILGTAPNWLHLPHPGFGLVQELRGDLLPPHRTLQDVCGSRGKDDLHNVTRVFEGRVRGAETVAVAADGRIAFADASNYLYVAKPASKDGKVDYKMVGGGPVGYLGPGRSMGLQFDAQGDLTVCDSVKGLLAVSKDGKYVCSVGRLVSGGDARQPSSRVGFANDLDIAKDGTVYFSESSLIQPRLDPTTRDWGMMEAYFLTTLKGEPSGRLLRYSPSEGVTVLLPNLWFANGVALSKDESFVVVAETNAQRLHRVWLKGDKAGTSDVLIDGLPGFPDGLSRASDGNIWVSLVAPGQPPQVQQASRSRLLRLLLAWLPAPMRPPPGEWGAVLKVSPTAGEVLDCLSDEDGSHVTFTSSVAEAADGKLWLGNLPGDYISYIDLRARQKAAADAAAADDA